MALTVFADKVGSMYTGSFNPKNWEIKPSKKEIKNIRYGLNKILHQKRKILNENNDDVKNRLYDERNSF